MKMLIKGFKKVLNILYCFVQKKSFRHILMLMCLTTVLLFNHASFGFGSQN
jgi:hypothetical protein